MKDERREFERLDLNAPIRYQRKGSQAFGRCLGKDIGRGGIGFTSHEFLPISTQLVFEVQHPQKQEFIKALGEVVWISDDPHSERFFVGARFKSLPVPL